jgi:multidrug efflux system outer membrane protein
MYIGLCLPVLQLNASAQSLNDSEISLDKAISLALENNLNLKKSEIDLAASGYSEKKLFAEIFPSINAAASIGYRNAFFSGITPAGSGLNYSTGFGISLGLNAGIPYAIKNIKLAHQGNILKYEDARNQLSILVTRKFYSLIAEKTNLVLLEEILGLAQRQHERDQVSFRNGLVRELVVIQGKLAVENARYNLSTASTSYANNMSEFLATLGLSGGEITLKGGLSIVRISVDAEDLINRHLSGRPDIARSRQEIERLEYSQKQSLIAGRAPSLNLSMDWNISNLNPYSDTFSGTARLSIPIDPWIPGTAKNQSFSRANDSTEKAKLDLTIAEESAKTQIRSLASLLHNFWDSIAIARLSLEAAQRSYELTEQGFRSGTVESLALEDARNNMANAKQRLLQTELSYFSMILDLSSALNLDWKKLIEDFGVQGEKK